MEWSEIERRTNLTEPWESILEKHFPACNFIQKLQAKLLYPSEHCYLKHPQLDRDDFLK